MKQRSLMKRVSAVLMAAALTISTFPQFQTNVYAAENQLPTKEQFATVEELKSFNTNDNDGEINPAKVYFGNNNQQWWIAGSQQENGLTLFAASALAKNQKFEPNLGQNKQYSADWKCDYISTGGSNPTDVYPNHYGASPLRTTLQGLETSYFTSAERGLMNSTTIYTNDTKNRSVYSTTDKLYLAYAEYYDGFDITAGTNNPNNLNDGLRIANVYLENSGILWLRAPYVSESNSALVVCRGRHADDYYVISDDITLVPAFELNLSSVIFASAAPAASSDGQLQTSDAYTLRYKTQASIGTATISQSKQSVAVTDVTNENTYLVVQTKDGAWAKKVSDNDLVFANEMSGTLTSFENCKVWLETTTDRITYASEATQGNGYNVKVNVGNNLTVNGGNTLQFNVSGDITEITIKANDGYYLPDGYKDTIQGLNGLTVTETENGFTISGTPTSDVNATLPAATVLPKADTPIVNTITTATSITIQVNNYKAVFGDIEYQWDNSDKWEKDKNVLKDLEPNTTHRFAVRYTGNGFYQMSEVYSAEIRTLKKDGNSVIVVPTNLETTYKEGLTLSEVVLPADSGWSWVDGNTKLSAGIKSHPATFDTTNLENTTDFSGVEGYDANTHKVTRKVEVKVNKANSTITITNSLNKVYDGQVVSNPEYTTSGSDGKVTVLWQENKNGQWEDLDKAPSTAGIYRVVVELAGNDNYNSSSATLEFVISKADNAWTEELSITGWTYNDKANAPTAKAQFGDIIFTYSNKENGTYTSEVPKNAGTYYVKATVAGTENYTGLESDPVAFEIAKADTTLTFEKDNIDKTYDKNVISEPSVTKAGSGNDVVFTWFVANGADWKQLDNAPSDVGKYKVVASVAEDNNYNGASIEKEFSISMADNEWTKELSIKDWTYGETANAPSAAAKFGDVTFTYSSEENGTYTNEVPKNAGTWYVKATVAGTANYTGLESDPVSFEIKKPDSSIKFKDGVTFDKVYDTNAVVVTEEQVEKTGSTGTVQFIFEKKVNDEWKTVGAATEVGTYRVTATLAEDNNHTSATSKPLEFTISKADSAVTITTQSLDKVYDGNAVIDPEYTTSGSDGKVTITWQKNTGTADTPKWEDLKSVPSTVGSYRVVVELAGNDNYNSANATLEFVISKADNAWTEELSITGWTYNDKANAPTAKAQFGDIIFTYSNKENGTYTSEVPKNAGTYYVKATVAGTENYTGLESVVSFTIAKADTTLTFEKDNIDKTYDKNAISEPKVTKNGSGNDIVFEWYIADENGWQKLDNAPSDVGAYKVVASVTEDTNYNGASIEKEFSISMADNEWTKELSIKDWTYGETASAPSATAKFGDATFTYSSEENGTYTNEVPKNAGTYHVKATVAGTENYTGLESVVSFEIAKAIPTYEKVTGLVLGQGQALGKIELPEKFKWVDETITADELGTHTFKAVYTPEDTANYQTIEVEIEVEVVPTPVAVNHVPMINASDKTITVGDKFDPMKDVTANDKEDGDLTSKIKVINNTVDTKKAGTYEVTYQVTDSQGATVTKTVKVTVKAAPVNPDKDKPDSDKNDGSVETGDRNNLLLWEVLLIGSSIALLYSLYRKKRKTQ